MNTLALIPARGGSKGVPRKNVKILGDKPLLAYSCEVARACKHVSKLVLSTDDSEIAEVGRKYGAEVPFMRPADYSDDKAPMKGVILHALEFLQEKENFKPDYVLLLQPTTPFRTVDDLEHAFKLMSTGRFDSIVSVTEIPRHLSPHWQFKIEQDELKIFTGEPFPELITRRQDLPLSYTRNGAIYLFKADNLAKTDSIYGNHCGAYIMPQERSINIDSMSDWERAEAYLKVNKN